MRNKMNAGGRSTSAGPVYGSSSGSQKPPLPAPSSGASQYSSSSSSSRSAYDREAEKKMARMNREKNALSRPKPVAPLFKVKRREDDPNEPLTQNLTNSLGNFNTFCQMKPAFGVEQAPPTPLPSHQMHDPDDDFPTRSPPPPLVSGNCIPPTYGGGTSVPPPNNNIWKPPQTSNSSALDPRIGSNKYSSYINAGNARLSTQPPPSSVVPKSNGSGGNGRLRPEQINAAAARAVAHRSSLLAGGHLATTTSRTSPVRPTIVPLSINEMAASFDLPDSIITPIKEPPRAEYLKNNRARRALLPHPTGVTPTTTPVLQPQPHVPPPPPSAYRQHAEAKSLDCSLTPWNARSGDDVTPIKTNQRNISLICADYPSQMDLSEESEEEGEIRERPRASAPSSSAPPPSSSQALPAVSNFKSVVDDDLLISDDDSSKSTSDSTSSESEDTSASSDEESNNKAKSSWNLSDLFKQQTNAAAGNSGNATSKVQSVASKATSANSDVSGDRNHVQERRGGGSSSVQRSPHSAAATVAARIPTSPIVSEESSDEDTPITRPIPQITAVPRPVEHSRSPYSSDSDVELEPQRSAPAYPKKGNKRSASATKRSTASSSKKSKMVPTVVAAPVEAAAPPPTKTGKRGRPKKVPDILPESKMKSKQFISTDDSDSDAETNKRRDDFAKTNRSRPFSTRSNSSLRRSPRRPSTARAAISTTPVVKTTASTNSHQKVNAAPIRDNDAGPVKVQQEYKPKPQVNSFLPPSMTMEFEFPTMVLPKPSSVEVESNKKTTEMCRTTASNTSDPNKKKLLGMLYGKSKDYANNQHDSASGKGKDSEKRVIKEKSDEASSVKKVNKQPEGEVRPSKRLRDPSVVDDNLSKKSKSEDSETSKSSRRGTKQSKSKDVPEAATAPAVAQDLPSIQPFSPPKKSKKSHRHDEPINRRGPRGGSASGCSTPASSNTPQQDSDHGRTTPETSEPQQLDFRVPLDGETSYAYQSRQSSATPTTTYSTGESANTNASSSSSSNLNGVDSEETRIAQSAATLDYTVDGQLISGGRPVNNRYTSRPPTTPVQDYYPPLTTFPRPRPTPTRYGSVVLPENVSGLYPTIAELEGKCIDDIFQVLFGRTADTITYQNNKEFVEEAIALKRKADVLNTERTTVIGTYYIEAVLYFIIAVQAMETDLVGVSPAITMCTGTMNVVAWLFSLIKKNSSQQLHAEYKAKLEVFCLLCQSMLSLKVYTMKRDELRCSQPILQEFYNRRSQPAAAAENGAGNGGGGSSTGNNSTTNQAANSPSAQSTPSPAESVNSESSHSSGYNTSNERRTRVNATPSPPQPPPLPSLADILRHQYTHYSVTTYLQSAYDTWSDAQQLIVSNKLQVFFAYLDRAVFPLSLHSNTLQLVCYIKAGLREIDRTMADHIERNRAHQNERGASHQSADLNVSQHERPGAMHHSDRNRVHGGSPAGAMVSSANRANTGVVSGTTPTTE